MHDSKCHCTTFSQSVLFDGTFLPEKDKSLSHFLSLTSEGQIISAYLGSLFYKPADSALLDPYVPYMLWSSLILIGNDIAGLGPRTPK